MRMLKKIVMNRRCFVLLPTILICILTTLYFFPPMPLSSIIFYYGIKGIEVDDGMLPLTATNLTLNDITITITTSYSLGERWNNILRTWYKHASESVVWVSDRGSKVFEEMSGGIRLLETNCSPGHSYSALSCKVGREFEEFMRRNTSKWWCHVDDDMYVNTDVLVRLLSKYDPDTDVYLGRNYYTYPLKHTWGSTRVYAWYATGGGFCISRTLAHKMEKYMSGGKLVEWGLKLHRADDVTIGFIVNYLLHTKLTVSKLILTHLKPHGLKNLPAHQIPQQAMLSYGYNDGQGCVNIKAEDVKGKSKFFNINEDPSRFLTIHCMIHPQTDYCQET